MAIGDNLKGIREIERTKLDSTINMQELNNCLKKHILMSPQGAQNFQGLFTKILGTI